MSKLTEASERLRVQLDDVMKRTSQGRVVQSGPPTVQEMIGYIVANQICLMMALVDLLETLDE